MPRPRAGVPGSKIAVFAPQDTLRTMEAERINQLSSLLADLNARSLELRRYL